MGYGHVSSLKFRGTHGSKGAEQELVIVIRVDSPSLAIVTVHYSKIVLYQQERRLYMIMVTSKQHHRPHAYAGSEAATRGNCRRTSDPQGWRVVVRRTCGFMLAFVTGSLIVDPSAGNEFGCAFVGPARCCACSFCTTSHSCAIYHD